MRRLLYRDAGLVSSLALLLFRMVIGAGMAIHGWPKIQDPFGWRGPGDHIPELLQALAAVGEFVAGLALIPGLLTPLASLSIIALMIGAVLTMIHFPAGDPFVALHGGSSFELPALYFVSAVVLLVFGPGRFSADAMLFRRPG